MKRRLLIPGAWVLTAVCLCSQPDFVIRSDVRLVLLDVDVKDRHGNSVSGLEKSNFRVIENGKDQPITIFAHEDLPVTVGILVDESSSMRPKRAQVLAAAETFVEASNPRDEVFVLNFNDTVTRGLPSGVPFSGDLGQLRSALARGIPRGRTSLHDAIIDGLEQLESGRRDKKALVVISDGGDTASRHTRAEMLKRVERSAATIYSIGVYDADDPDRDPRMLREIARISGGDAFFPETPEQTVPICRRIAQDIRSRYTIGYIPPASGSPDSPRQARVRVSSPQRGKLTARTRSTYRYDQLETSSKK